MNNRKHIYGNLCNYRTDEIIRPANREEWLYAREHGARYTGAFEMGGLTLFVDGPTEDPAAWRIVNRTPHDIVVLPRNGSASDKPVLVLPQAPRGEVARVETTAAYAHTITSVGGDVDVVSQKWGQVVGLPAVCDGTYHVVSAIVAAAARASGRGCRDLLAPGDQVRDDSGRIVGCRGLVAASDSFPTMSAGAEVWVEYTPADLLAFGVAQDLVNAAQQKWAQISRPFELVYVAERQIWDRLSALAQAHWPEAPTSSQAKRSPGHEVLRSDLLDLVECMLRRPHRRAIATSAD